MHLIRKRPWRIAFQLLALPREERTSDLTRHNIFVSHALGPNLIMGHGGPRNNP